MFLVQLLQHLPPSVIFLSIIITLCLLLPSFCSAHLDLWVSCISNSHNNHLHDSVTHSSYDSNALIHQQTSLLIALSVPQLLNYNHLASNPETPLLKLLPVVSHDFLLVKTDGLWSSFSSPSLQYLKNLRSARLPSISLTPHCASFHLLSPC